MNHGPRSHPARFPGLFSLFGMLVALCAIATPARAGTEVYLDGYFRLRYRVFDNLTLKREIPLDDDSTDPATAGSQGTSDYFQQRLRLSPELRVNQYLSVFAQIDVLPDLTWGTNPERLAGLDAYYDPIGESQSFFLPNNVPLVAPRRVWGEVYTPIGRLKIGRTAQHVGAGIFFNDGNSIDADYGDTADRIQFLTRFGPVYLLLGYDMIYEGDYDRPYDAQAGAAAIAYRSELLSGSFYTYYSRDRSWRDEGTVGGQDTEDTINRMDNFTFDLWGKATIGPVDLEAEAIYRYGYTLDQTSLPGGMVLEPVDDNIEARLLTGVTRSEYGGMARATWNSKYGKLGIETGIASGDPDSFQSTSLSGTTALLKMTRFRFDRDYHIAYLLFRQPMAARASRSTDSSPNDTWDTAVVGDSISNAFFLVPSIEYPVLENLSARLSGVAAWALETNSDFNNETDYGYEIDLNLSSRWYDKLTVSATGAMFFPGQIFKDNNEFAFGGELRAVIEF